MFFTNIFKKKKIAKCFYNIVSIQIFARLKKMEKGEPGLNSR